MQARQTTAQYRRAWQERFGRERERERESEAAARQALPRAVEILRGHGATRVWLFGSLACDGRFRPGSDIDLAVEGIPPNRIDRALADLMMALDFPVDLKLLESVDEHFRQAILERGVSIHAPSR